MFKVPQSGGCVAEVQTTCTPPPAPKCPDGDRHMLGPRAIYHIFCAQMEGEGSHLIGPTQGVLKDLLAMLYNLTHFALPFFLH